MDKKQPLSSKRNIGILALILGVVVVVVLFAQRQAGPLTQEQKECMPPYGKGKQTYDIRTDKPKDLQIVEIVVDPIDVKFGEMQKIVVKVKDKGNDTISNASGVSADIITDNKATAIAASAFKLARAEDENGKDTLITFWEGWWQRDDSFCQNYQEAIKAVNDKGQEAEVTLTFR